MGDPFGGLNFAPTGGNLEPESLLDALMDNLPPPQASNTSTQQPAAQEKQDPKKPTGGQQGTKQGTQKQPDNMPNKFVIEASKTQNKGSYSIFFYQLENAESKPLTGKGYSVEEHMSGDLPRFIHPVTSEGTFVPATHGEVEDLVGLLSGPPGKGANEDLILYQTFTVKYNGREFNLGTEFMHETRVVNGSVTNSVIDLLP